MTGGDYAATHQTLVKGTPEEVWRLLTEPAQLSGWFADVAYNREKTSFTCAFGDGDFFAGLIKDWDAPFELGLVWKFMDLGPEYSIRFNLSPAENGIRVTVIDTGALSAEEAESLKMGWQDFFQRLARYARTGENSRYAWSQEISVTVSLGDKKQSSPVQLLPENWWNRHFPDAEVTLTKSDANRAIWRLSQSDWSCATTVTGLIEKHLSGGFLNIAHQGWEEILPSPANIAVRKRYAEIWCDALRPFEQLAASF